MWIELITAALLANGCPEPERGQPAPVSAHPDWLLKPSSDDIYWAFPSRAIAERLTGRAIIQCEVSEQGAAEACSVLSEEPEGYGFGEAAIGLTSKMLFKPRLECGAVTRGTIRIPLAFKFPETTPAPSTAPLDPANKKLALAARLVAALKMSELIRANSDDGAAGMIRMTDEARGATEQEPLTVAERQVMHDTAREVWMEHEPKVLNALVRHYAGALTEDELNASLTYFESPAGQKMVGAVQRADEAWGAVMETLAPDMLMSFQRRTCERSASLCAEEGEL